MDKSVNTILKGKGRYGKYFPFLLCRGFLKLILAWPDEAVCYKPSVKLLLGLFTHNCIFNVTFLNSL